MHSTMTTMTAMTATTAIHDGPGKIYNPHKLRAGQALILVTFIGNAPLHFVDVVVADVSDEAIVLGHRRKNTANPNDISNVTYFPHLRRDGHITVRGERPNTTISRGSYLYDMSHPVAPHYIEWLRAVAEFNDLYDEVRTVIDTIDFDERNTDDLDDLRHVINDVLHQEQTVEDTKRNFQYRMRDEY